MNLHGSDEAIRSIEEKLLEPTCSCPAFGCEWCFEPGCLDSQCIFSYNQNEKRTESI